MLKQEDHIKSKRYLFRFVIYSDTFIFDVYACMKHTKNIMLKQKKTLNLFWFILKF